MEEWYHGKWLEGLTLRMSSSCLRRSRQVLYLFRANEQHYLVSCPVSGQIGGLEENQKSLHKYQSLLEKKNQLIKNINTIKINEWLHNLKGLIV